MNNWAVESADGGSQRGRIFAAIELSKAKWIVALCLPHLGKVSLYEIAGGDAERLLALLDRARTAATAQGVEATEIYTCYEAGYDGFWLHRLLEAGGIHNSVLDLASIQVSRRRRRLKTDRTDAESLLRVFMAWHRGERQACSVVRVPSPEDEDMKRLHRSRANLLRERVRHVNRIRGLLHLQGVVHVHPHREGWAAALGHVSFMWSYPNLIPLSAAKVRPITELLEPFAFDVNSSPRSVRLKGKRKRALRARKGGAWSWSQAPRPQALCGGQGGLRFLFDLGPP